MTLTVLNVLRCYGIFYYLFDFMLCYVIFTQTNIGQVDHMTGCVYVVLLKASRVG